MNRFFALVFVVGFATCQSTNKDQDQQPKDFWSPEESPELIGKMMIEDLLSRSTFMMYETEQLTVFHYAEACAGYGATRLAGFLNDTTTIKRLASRYIRVIEDSMPNPANHVDANVYGILPLELYKHTKDSRFLDQGMELANKQWENPLPDGLTNQTRYWIDDIYMIASIQCEAYRITKDPVYLDRAALEIVSYLDKLQQPNGLFFHGEKAPLHWGRGNGWVAAGLAELISVLPDTHALYPRIVSGYKMMMDALLQYQAEDGMWRQLIDMDDSWKETSCTAMFGYAFCVGVSRGILEEERFRQPYEKAWNSLVKYVNDEGKLTDVCVGTGQSDDKQYYLDRPRTTGDFHGQAPMLWFAHSLLNR